MKAEKSKLSLLALGLPGDNLEQSACFFKIIYKLWDVGY